MKKSKKVEPRTLDELWSIAAVELTKLVDMNCNSAEISTIIHALGELNRQVDTHIFREKLAEKKG